MKKRFLVEIDYEELEENKDSPVLCDTSLEVAVDDLMYGYMKAKSIKEEYYVYVEEFIVNGKED